MTNSYFAIVEQDIISPRMAYEKFVIDYSMKNIPICKRSDYELRLINQTKSFLRRVRLKSYFYEKDDQEDDTVEYEQKETFGFKSSFNPPSIKILSNLRRI